MFAPGHDPNTLVARIRYIADWLSGGEFPQLLCDLRSNTFRKRVRGHHNLGEHGNCLIMANNKLRQTGCKLGQWQTKITKNKLGQWDYLQMLLETYRLK
jgi:hypothetical protein